MKQKLLFLFLIGARLYSMDEFGLYDGKKIDSRLIKMFIKIKKSDDVGQTIKKWYREKPFDLNVKDDYGNTPLHYFIDHETMIYNHHFAHSTKMDYNLFHFKDMITFFCDNKADFNITNDSGHTALHKAVELLPVSKDMIQILLDHKSDPNQECRGLSPLYLLLNTSIYFYLPNIVGATKVLLEYKANPHWHTKEGTKVFHLALNRQQYHHDLLIPFLKSGINPCEYYTYEHLPYQAINPNNGDKNRSLYLTFLAAIPAWIKQKRKISIETLLLCLKALKKKNSVFLLPPKRVLHYCIENFILPGYNQIKDAIKKIDENNLIISYEDQQKIDEKMKNFMSFYS